MHAFIFGGTFWLSEALVFVEVNTLSFQYRHTSFIAQTSCYLRPLSVSNALHSSQAAIIALSAAALVIMTINQLNGCMAAGGTARLSCCTAPGGTAPRWTCGRWAAYLQKC